MSNHSRTEWPDKRNLPTPNELHALLEQGTSCRVTTYTLSPDEHGVWITNPYGNDSLWQELTIERVEKFLADVAMEKEYGLMP